MTPTPVETSEEIEIAASVWATKDRPLSAEDDARLSAWLSGDTRRRGALLRAQATWAMLNRVKALDTAGLADIEKRRVAIPSRRGLLLGAGAGGIAAAAFAATVIVRGFDETATETGEIRRLPMSDGSVAAINTDSAIRIDMTPSQRNIELVRGEAWFKVAKNRQRPFVVSAGIARVQAVGTAFSVRRNDTGIEVLVTEGTVKAWLEGQERPAVWLSAGDRGVLRPEMGAAKDYAPTAIDDALAWREGQIALTGQSLQQAAAEYNRYNRVKIVIDDPELANERLLGRFSTDDPDGFSNAVAHAFGAEIIRTDKAIYLHSKKN